NGWNNTPVVVAFSAIDGLSGVAAGSVTAPVTLSTDGAGQSASGTATDIAGNVGRAAVSGINIDRTKPSIAVSLSPAPNPNGLYAVPVTAHFTCSDTGSGIDTCPADVVAATAGLSQTVSGTAIDRAGNPASVTSAPFSIVFAKPMITVTLSPSANA